ncbi:MAG: hypothetical protein NTX50_28985 [Candidatus Sumerlaeota bacterium]|nr:hypothetical protein [Candidatus Sumerlaeota bacterium]
MSDSNSIPGARGGAVSWIDVSGALWLFGGYGFGGDGAGSGGYLSDLWKYSPSDKTWTWIRGASIVNQAGAYGRQGLADPANMPGTRTSPGSWMETSGALWLFGGTGYDGAWCTGQLNDLWRFGVVSTCTLTYIAGPNGAIAGDTSQTVQFGADGTTVTAIPDADYHFLQWSDGLTRNPRRDRNVMMDLIRAILEAR